MEDVINTNPGALDNWTSYIFPSPSKSPSSPVHVTCLELHQVPHTSTTLLLQATPGAFSIYNANTMEAIGRKHSTEGDTVLLARFINTGSGSLPNVLLVAATLSVYSLEEECSLHEIPFPSPIADILDIQVNASVVAVLSHHTIRLLDRRLNYTVSHTLPTSSNAMALGSRWLAYPIHDPESLSTASSVATKDEYSLTDIAQGVASGLYYLSKMARRASADSEGGHLAVRDCISHTCIASFEAHSSAITSIAFDPSGMLVVSSSDKGQTLHVHRVQDGALLYRLHRGITHARIRHVATSLDSKWIAVTTSRGTTHIYAIRPDGGAIGGHTHAAVDLNDPTHLAVAKASIADEVQAKRFLLGGTETLHPLARLRHSSVDTVGSGLVCCHWHASHLLVASGGFLKALAVKPRSNVVDAPKPWLVLSLHLDVAKQRELDPRSSTTLPRFTDPIKPNGPAVETVTHVHHEMPIWHHPKVTFRALSWGKFRVLNVKRLGPVPLSTDDVVLEQLTQGESPVFDGTPSRDEPFVPPLDLSASISHAVTSSLTIRPHPHKNVPTTSTTRDAPPSTIQDAYF